MDYERIHAGSERKAWPEDHQVEMHEAYPGIQGAAWKQCPPSQSAGAWSGSIVRTNNIDIGSLVSEYGWEKMKIIVLRFQAQVLENPEVDLCTHSLISDIGTLGYLTQTYDHLTPYLKGFHLTIYGWLPDRDGYGCKVATARLKSEKVTEA